MTTTDDNISYQRYQRQIILPEINHSGQEKISKAKVLVIGAGGLGCPVLQYLVAAGVGSIGIVDGDTVSISNLHRQILYNTQDLGKPKASTAAQKLKELNPLVEIKVFQENIHADNVFKIFENYQIIVDCSDNFATRYLVNDACVITKKTFVSASIYKFEGQLSVFNYKNGPTYRCIFPSPPENGSIQNCSEIGVIGAIAGILGTLQAAETIKVILRLGDILSGKLLLIDMLTMSFNTLKFRTIPTNKAITRLIDYEVFCGEIPKETVQSIQYETILSWQKQNKKFQLIDVREKQEHLVENIGGENIPSQVLDNNTNLINLTSDPIIFYCQSGNRSESVIKNLLKNKIKGDFFHLNGGLNSIKTTN
ncbi:MAG: HesA/MoeB/ThiF family protein [Pseudarcicella sp.]|nr:HesA/MoeB/ThiF family protein [Pseudarcicella sp.]